MTRASTLAAHPSSATRARCLHKKHTIRPTTLRCRFCVFVQEYHAPTLRTASPAARRRSVRNAKVVRARRRAMRPRHECHAWCRHASALRRTSIDVTLPRAARVSVVVVVFMVYLQYLQAGILLLLASYTCRQAYYYYLHARAKVALDQHQTCCCFLFLTMQGTRTCQTTHTFSLHIQDSHTYDRL